MLEGGQAMQRNNKPSPRLTNEQEALWYLGGQRIISALGDQLAGAFHLTELVTPAGTFISALRGKREDEAQYVLAGEATLVCGGQTVDVSAGTFLFLPGGVPYQMQVGASSPLSYLTWRTPAGFAHEVTTLGTPNQPLVLAPPPAPDRAKVQHLAGLLRAATVWPVLEYQPGLYW